MVFNSSESRAGTNRISRVRKNTSRIIPTMVKIEYLFIDNTEFNRFQRITSATTIVLKIDIIPQSINEISVTPISTVVKHICHYRETSILRKSVVGPE